MPIEEINEARRQKIKMGMSPDVFTVYWLLKKEGINNPDMANKMGDILEKYRYWRESEGQERNLKIELIAVCIESKISIDEASELVNKILRILKSAKQ